MFYASKALLSVKGIYPKTHKGVVSEFGLRFVNEGYIKEIYGKILSKVIQQNKGRSNVEPIILVWPPGSVTEPSCKVFK